MSVTKQCAGLGPGDSVLIECDSVKQATNISRRMTAVDRLPKSLKEMRFSCAVYTAVALKDGSIIYINKVTRTD